MDQWKEMATSNDPRTCATAQGPSLSLPGIKGTDAGWDAREVIGLVENFDAREVT